MYCDADAGETFNALYTVKNGPDEHIREQCRALAIAAGVVLGSRRDKAQFEWLAHVVGYAIERRRVLAAPVFCLPPPAGRALSLCGRSWSVKTPEPGVGEYLPGVERVTGSLVPRSSGYEYY